MFVILTSKPGVFTTELGEGMELVEAWDYLYFGRERARFVIANLPREVKVRVTDGSSVNYVPSKFLPRFASVEKARAELEQLARGAHISLVKR